MRDAEDEFEEGFDDEYTPLDPCADCGFYHCKCHLEGCPRCSEPLQDCDCMAYPGEESYLPEDQRDIFPRTSSIAWQDAVRERIERKQLAERLPLP